MNDPMMELPLVINSLMATDSTYIDQLPIREYFTEDVEFRHPLVVVNSDANSRENMLSLYKFSKGLTWSNRIEVHQVWFHEAKKIGLVQFTQHIQPLLFPYLNVTMKTIAQLEFRLTKDGRKWLISRLEDVIPNEDLLNAVIPHSRPFVNYFKALGGLAAVGVGSIFEKVGWC
ncbi:9793_t:CDS:2 [Ambispora gerdemannii]|uniref:9793_t:CDS:1 n=1 Tax=Ambispora gerdemannii TaxID=144530 RepID=A0A9N9C487_9GLOM|nr:9793_t:CDS:2 [Ambispora gerdemannii]